MNKNEIANKIINSAIEEFNEFLDSTSKLNPGYNEELIGSNGKLDSLGIIMFIGTLESKSLEHAQKEIALLNQDYLVDTSGPYKNLHSIEDHIISLL
jgi:hypothetical protein